MVNGIIFDMDGTLVDSEISHAKMVLEMFEDYGEEIPLSVCLSQTGIVYERAVKVYYQYWNKSSFNDFQQIYLQHRLAWKREVNYREIIFPHVREVLQLCKEREIKTAIASGSEMHMIEKMATDCELLGIVDLLLSGADLPNNKPAPDIYLKSLETDYKESSKI